MSRFWPALRRALTASSDYLVAPCKHYHPNLDYLLAARKHVYPKVWWLRCRRTQKDTKWLRVRQVTWMALNILTSGRTSTGSMINPVLAIMSDDASSHAIRMICAPHVFLFRWTDAQVFVECYFKIDVSYLSSPSFSSCFIKRFTSCYSFVMCRSSRDSASLTLRGSTPSRFPKTILSLVQSISALLSTCAGDALAASGKFSWSVSVGFQSWSPSGPPYITSRYQIQTSSKGFRI